MKKESNFQLINLPKILKFKFDANQESISDKTNLNLGVSSKSEINYEDKIIQIQLEINIETEKGGPFQIDSTIVGDFKFKNNPEEDELMIFVKSIAPSILLSYSRPIISQFITYSGYPPYIIPLLDLREN